MPFVIPSNVLGWNGRLPLPAYLVELSGSLLTESLRLGIPAAASTLRHRRMAPHPDASEAKELRGGWEVPALFRPKTTSYGRATLKALPFRCLVKAAVFAPCRGIAVDIGIVIAIENDAEPGAAVLLSNAT